MAGDWGASWVYRRLKRWLESLKITALASTRKMRTANHDSAPRNVTQTSRRVGAQIHADPKRPEWMAQRVPAFCGPGTFAARPEVLGQARSLSLKRACRSSILNPQPSILQLQLVPPPQGAL